MFFFLQKKRTIKFLTWISSKIIFIVSKRSRILANSTSKSTNLDLYSLRCSFVADANACILPTKVWYKILLLLKQLKKYSRNYDWRPFWRFITKVEVLVKGSQILYNLSNYSFISFGRLFEFRICFASRS